MEHIARVGVVLLNWNGAASTIPCIESLLAGSRQPWRILVVDNGSADHSDEQIRARFPFVELIRNPHNLGASGGRNVGVRYMLAEGAEATLLLDNDTIVAGGCLETLVRCLDDDPQVAVATGKIMLQEPPNRIWYAGADWRHFSFTAPHRGRSRVDHGQFDTPCDVGFAPTCCMLIRSEAFERVGLFSERYWFYWEDAEWCLRARRAELRLRFVPAAVLWHRSSNTYAKNTLGSSRGTASAAAHYLITRNRLVTIRRYSRSSTQTFVAIAIVLIGSLYRTCGFTALGRWEKLTALWRGLVEGMTCSLAGWEPAPLEGSER